MLKSLTFILWFLPRGPRGTDAVMRLGEKRPEIDSSPSSYASRLCSTEMLTLSLPGLGAVCARTKGLQCPLLLIQLHKHEIYRHTQESITETFPLVMFSCWKVGALLNMNVNSRKEENKPSEPALGNTPSAQPHTPTPSRLQVIIFRAEPLGGEFMSFHRFGEILLNFAVTLKVNYFLSINKIYP